MRSPWLHVARQVVQPRQASLIPERVHGLRGASRLNPRGARSIVGVETTTSRVLCGHFHVRPELVFQVGVAPAWKQRSLKTLNPFAKGTHAISLTHAPAGCGFIRHTNRVSLTPLERQMKSRDENFATGYSILSATHGSTPAALRAG